MMVSGEKEEQMVMVREEEVVLMVRAEDQVARKHQEEVVVSRGVDDAEVVVQREMLRSHFCVIVSAHVCVCVCAATMRVLAYVQANPGPAIEEIKDLVRGLAG